MLENKLEEKFLEVFGVKPEHKFFAPGRVNLIGEHTDYNGGNVFPCAIDKGTVALVRKREDRIIRLYSENFEHFGVYEGNLDEIVYKKEDNWTNYVKGTILMFQTEAKLFDKITNGFDILFYGNIPNGSGLSSSASIQSVVAITLDSLFNLNVDRIQMAKLVQASENKFIGVQTGIMDQFSICMGKKDNAILLDCNTLIYEYVPVILKDEVILISNTKKQRGLAGSKYNERRAECEEALVELQKELNVKSLGEISIPEFEKYKHLIQSEVRQKRAKHAVYENQRTLQAKEALTKGDLKTFGELMNASHKSLKDDYEVTGLELDTIVELQWELKDSVIGSRMTGAGFGGCAVSIVKKDKVQEVIDKITPEYTRVTGLEPEFYIASVEDGAKQLW